MTEGEKALQVDRQPLNIDMRNGIRFSNYGEAMQMAALMHASGLAPKSLDTVQKVAVAMLMAYEVGLPIVTGIQNIAVINGKAGLWGDATIALVRSSGAMDEGYPKERVEGTPYQDDWTFYCTVKRKNGQEVTGSFSWAEARRAGFVNPKTRDGRDDTFSPWVRFPRRMMQWKARQWVYRDEFGDVLKGMRMAEELDDYIDLEPSTSSRGPGSSPWELAPAPPFDFEAFKADLERGGISSEHLNAFMMALANHFKKPIPEIIPEIEKDPESFVRRLKEWVDRNAKQAPAAPEQAQNEPKVPPPSDDHGQTENVDPGPENAAPGTEEDPRRAEYINLRSAGFSTWAWKHLERINNPDLFTDDHRAEIQAKWMKLYPNTPFPGQQAVTTAPQQTPANAEGYVWCKRDEARKPVRVCESKCTYAGSCDEYRAFRYPSEPEQGVSCPDMDGKEVPESTCGECESRQGCPSWADETKI